ncbi:MAG: aldo/keto reductase [Cyclobacteriaceae bacterium]|nr:aldo/keto reductase [Cyclobacteriaceae bacterium]
MKKDQISRRKFISNVSAGSALLLANGVMAGSLAQQKIVDPFQTVTLGNSGIKTSFIGMGTGVSGGDRKSAIVRAGREKAISMVKYAYDRGVRMFDAADIYGTHDFVAEALRRVPRESYTLTSKIWFRPGGIPEAERPDANVVVDRFRKELRTDYIDIMQIHCMETADWTDEQKKQMDILQGLKEKGIIRSHGVSIHTLDALEACVDSPWVDIVHTRINAFGDTMDNNDPEKVLSVIKRIHDAGKGVIGMKLIGNGNFRNDPEKINTSLKYVLNSGAVDMVIVGFDEHWQIDNYAERVRNALKSMS